MDIKGFKSKDGTVYEYDYDSLANKPENDTATDERIAAAVEKYLTENPVDGVTDQQVYDAVVAYLTENPIEGVSDEQIAQAVADYMVKNPVDVTGVVKSVNGVEPDENGNVEITIPDSSQNVEIDTTLTQSGKAADAKTVGDKLATKTEQKMFERFLAKMGLTMEDLIEKLPQVRITGDLSGISSDDYVNVMCNYTDELNGVEFTDYAEIAWQGSSTLGFTNVEDGVDKAKNYKIKLYTDETRENKSKRVFKDWFATNNFHIKANYGDCTNFMNNMMMHYLTKSYQYLTPLPRDGARYTVDGFPVLLYVNDVFCGIRFWNLKQDDKVYNLNEEEVDESGNITQEADLCYQIGLNNGSNTGDNSGAFVYGNLNSGSNTGKNFADAHAEIDYYWEDRVWDKLGDHPAVLYDTIQWVSEATDEEFKSNLANYFDVDYLINYFVCMYTCGMIDSKAKNFNMLYFPDAGKWYATPWDMDYAMGTSYGTTKTAYNVELSNFGCPSSRLFDKLWANFKDECIAKYKKLRETLFTTEQVADSVDQTILNVSAEWLNKSIAVKYDGTIYSDNVTADPKTFIVNWAKQRFAYMDTVFVSEEDKPADGIIKIGIQGNDSVNGTETNRATVLVHDIRVPANGTVSVAVADGYSVLPYGVWGVDTAEEAGLYPAQNVLSTMAVADDSSLDGYAGFSCGFKVTDLAYYNPVWSTEPLTITCTYSSNGVTLSHLGFVVKKTDESDITPDEAVAALTITAQESTDEPTTPPADGIPKTGIQGNASVSGTETNRATVLVNDIRVPPKGTVTIAAADGYSVLPYGIWRVDTPEAAGAYPKPNVLSTMVVGDNDSIYGENGLECDFKVTDINYYDPVWSTEPLTITCTWSSNGDTISHLGFVVKKTDDSAITPDEAVAALTITGHEPKT